MRSTWKKSTRSQQLTDTASSPSKVNGNITRLQQAPTCLDSRPVETTPTNMIVSFVWKKAKNAFSSQGEHLTSIIYTTEDTRLQLESTLCSSSFGIICFQPVRRTRAFKPFPENTCRTALKFPPQKHNQ